MLRTFVLSQLIEHRKKIFLIVFVLFLSMFVTTSIDVISDNIKNQIETETKPILGGDISISSTKPFDKLQTAFLDSFAKKNNIDYQPTVQFSTNLFSGDDSKLVKVLGITDKYPFYGKLDIKENFVNASGGVLVDQETYDLFAKNNKIKLGNQLFYINGIIRPSQFDNLNVFDGGRTIIAPYQKIIAAQFTELGSRVSYRYLLKLPNGLDSNKTITSLKNEAIFDTSSINNSSRTVQQLDDNFGIVKIFFVVVSLGILLLAFIVINNTFTFYFIENSGNISLLQILGLSKSKIYIFFVGFFILVTLLAGMLSYGFIELLFNFLKSFPLTSSWAIGYDNIAKGLSIGFIVFLISSFFVINNNIQKLAINQLRNSYIGEIFQGMSKTNVIIAFIGFFSCVYLLIGDIIQSGIAVLSLVVLFVIIYIFSFILLKNGKRLFSKEDFIKYDAIRYTLAPGNKSILFIASFTISFVIFVVVGTFGYNINQRLRIDLQNQPSLFVTNIPKDKINNISGAVFDIISARIFKVNGVSLSDYLLSKKIDGGQFTREFNITTKQEPSDVITLGKAIVTGGISMDEDFAKELFVNIGDKITLSIQGREFDLTITNFRKSIRNGSSPFFFIKLDSSEFADAPKNFFWPVLLSGGVNINEVKKNLVNDLGPKIVIIEVGAIIDIIKNFSSSLLYIINFLILIIIILSFMVNFMNMSIGILLKRYKFILYNIFGSSKDWLSKNNIYEYMYIFAIMFIMSSGFGLGIPLLIIKNSSLLIYDKNTFLFSLLLLSVCFVLSISILLYGYILGKMSINKNTKNRKTEIN